MRYLDQVYNEGIAVVHGEHFNTQLEFANVIGSTRGIPGEYLMSIGAFFVPNNEYMLAVFGEDLRDPEYGCYVGDDCVWAGHLVFPIYNVADVVKGFVGFNPEMYLAKKEDATLSGNHYTLSGKRVFTKGNFLYTPKEVYKKAFDDGYLFLTDGLFDAISLNYEGFNAAAMLGSAVTDAMIMQLRFVQRVIFVTDNDQAGMKVYRRLAQSLHNVELYKQGFSKDIDELLHSDKRDRLVADLKSLVNQSESTRSISVFR
ncbi:toprim domain-containing protein [Acetivibrio ethanolgignens]|uniref:Toprim domain-containing protein n=1 Tax=Acetivibrio ethanolgignens TaxID=290052 RepID=A0A0V8QBC9_9FIRM|nr:toprim domain-containing protein [Acetivibrio ethanolgignens]KSV57901.1 hypothetical protein ASU35_14915 [Acetivibrio ethanolgignens]